MNKGIHSGDMSIPFDEQAMIDFIEANRNGPKRIGYYLDNLQLRIYELDGDNFILSYEYYGHLSTPKYFRVKIIDQKIFVSISSDYPGKMGRVHYRPHFTW